MKSSDFYLVLLAVYTAPHLDLWMAVLMSFVALGLAFYYTSKGD